MDKLYKSKEKGWFELEHGLIQEKMIAITSGKGGVGKSTVTANLAFALNKLGKKVGVIDADIYGFSIPRIMGLKEKPRGRNEEEIIPPQVEGIKVMSMGSMVTEDKAIIWRGPMLLGVLKQFMQEVIWGELDYLLFDLPPGTGDMTLNIMQQISDADVMVVTTPQAAAANVAVRVGNMAKQLDTNIIGVIENMSYYECLECGKKEYIFGKNGGGRIADNLGTKLLGELPLLPKIREGSDQGSSIILTEPESKVSQEFKKIARQIVK
ncbi:Mrp/NBP35 family ATP-binding protein [Orenia marismortui]|uniref:Mrp/NBP35 family ATP-binding protein n=1 Tax=Orenia marismortui TaxID=46469 RepID=UPI00037DCA3C|nr:Mrp/NBP35 family ATP-binding protein [Orenia marismortui]